MAVDRAVAAGIVELEPGRLLRRPVAEHWRRRRLVVERRAVVVAGAVLRIDFELDGRLLQLRRLLGRLRVVGYVVAAVVAVEPPPPRPVAAAAAVEPVTVAEPPEADE